MAFMIVGNIAPIVKQSRRQLRSAPLLRRQNFNRFSATAVNSRRPAHIQPRASTSPSKNYIDGSILPGLGSGRAHASIIDVLGSYSPASASPGTSYNEHKPKTPPPDLPSLLLDSRIVYIGMPLVPAVTELIVSELLYMQYTDPNRACYIYINSTGCQRADGEVVGFETEATAIYDTMKYIGNEIYTVGTGVAYGQACMLLSAGNKGKRYMTSHATAMLHQPRVPSTGQRQAVEVHIKWKEVLEQKKAMLDILHQTTGHPIHKLDKDMQRPMYMTAKDAISYGIIDKVVDKTSKAIDDVTIADKLDAAAGLIKTSSQSGSL